MVAPEYICNATAIDEQGQGALILAPTSRSVPSIKDGGAPLADKDALERLQLAGIIRENPHSCKGTRQSSPLQENAAGVGGLCTNTATALVETPTGEVAKTAASLLPCETLNI